MWDKTCRRSFCVLGRFFQDFSDPQKMMNDYGPLDSSNNHPFVCLNPQKMRIPQKVRSRYSSENEDREGSQPVNSSNNNPFCHMNP